ncbi:hypothetical protein [Bacillus sp. K2I17]|uniref:hypothetical protein n=1 Tax=Bacillus sp. K2I17 TaxID=2014743 RepID=UPI000B51CED8|nr:hypothetical protein [Bacillus sp. K2I17]OWT48469.1 hypothetical protein CER22_25620 [Bacillus sp. K2I17]
MDKKKNEHEVEKVTDEKKVKQDGEKVTEKNIQKFADNHFNSNKARTVVVRFVMQIHDENEDEENKEGK